MRKFPICAFYGPQKPRANLLRQYAHKSFGAKKLSVVWLYIRACSDIWEGK